MSDLTSEQFNGIVASLDTATKGFADGIREAMPTEVSSLEISRALMRGAVRLWSGTLAPDNRELLYHILRGELAEEIGAVEGAPQSGMFAVTEAHRIDEESAP